MKKLLKLFIFSLSFFATINIQFFFDNASFEFAAAPSVVFAQNQNPGTNNSGAVKDKDEKQEKNQADSKKSVESVSQEDLKTALLDDSVNDGGGFMNCGPLSFGCKIINGIQWIVIVAGNALVGLSAKVMDFFLHYSLQSTSYGGSRVIHQGWEILRDLTNIVFIFALLSAAFRITVDKGSSAAKQQVLKTILVALTINFSLYLSFAIIDAGNILGQVFYNKIEKADVSYTPYPSDNESIEEMKAENSMSVAIANKINPQKIFIENKDVTNKSKRVVMIVMGGIINFTLIMTFLSVSFLFLGRTVSLWFSAILSALAFATLTIPELSKRDYFGFSKWLSTLINASFMAPVFLFFLYLTVTFMNIGIKTTPGTDFLTQILAVIIPMIFIVMLIKVGKDVAESMAGQIATSVSGAVMKVAGGALAIGGMAATVATGGVAGAALKGASNLAEKKGKGKTAKVLRGMGRSMSQMKSLDISKIPGFKSVLPDEFKQATGRFAGKSWSGTVTKMQDKKYAAKDFIAGRAALEEEEKTRKEREARKAQSTRGADGLYAWERDIQKARQKDEDKKVADEIKETVKASTEFGENLKQMRTEEKEFYREMLDHPMSVELEKKSLKALEDNVKNAQQRELNAKASGNKSHQRKAKMASEVAKVKLAARKQGFELDDAQATTFVQQNSSKGPDYIKNGNFTSLGGTVVDNYFSDYQKKRAELNNKEREVLAKKIEDIRKEAKDLETQASTLKGAEKYTKEQEAKKLQAQATQLSKQTGGMLTDSEKLDQKGQFDKPDAQK